MTLSPQLVGRAPTGRVVATLSLLLALVLMVPATAAADVERISGDGLVPAVRWSGTNRYDTAALIATDGEADAPVFAGDTVVVARGDAFPDGLAGSFLAGMVDAPVLLTAPDSLPDETDAALDQLDPNRIIILGGRGAISNDVEDALRAGRRGISIVRHSGTDRFETAADIAAAGARAGEIGMYNGMATAILVTGERPADALTAGPLAAAEGFPVFLTHQGQLPAAAAETMGDLGIQHVLIVGGEAAVGAPVADAVTDLGITVERLSGTTRETTAMDVAEFARDELGWTLNQVHFAGAADRAFPDSLALAPRSALSESPILLLGGVGPSGPVREFLRGLDAVDAVAVAGGGAAVSPRALANARTGLAVQLADLAFPRGFGTHPDGTVYVAVTGFGGEDCIGEGEEQVCFGPTASITPIQDGAPVFDELPSGNFGGVADVAFDAAGTPVAAVGLGVPASIRDEVADANPIASNFGTLAAVTDGGLSVLADLAQWEADNNPDRATPETSLDPPLNSNPFSVARDEAGDVWVVADAGGNSLLQVDDNGAISLLAVLPAVETDEGARQYVPTSVVVGPDGAYYVGGLGGEVPGAANIYRYDPVTEELTVEEEGFTFVLDLGFDDAGNLYVLQAVPTNPDVTGEDPGPGVVIQVTPEGERSELGGGGLVFPVGLEVTPEGLYVSHCPFCPAGGEVLQLQATAPLG